MPKKKALTEKNVVTEEKKTITPEKKEKEKNFSKPLAFFGIFVICISIAMLYPYLTQESSVYVPVQSTTLEDFQSVEPEFVEELPEETPQVTIEEDKQEDCSSKDSVILSQEKTIDGLNEKIHQLELENLSLKEKTASSEEAVLLTVRLMKKIYTGQPFDVTLNKLQNEDSSSFALTVQEKLGDYATKGIATPEKLKKLFLLNAETAQNSFYASNPEDSWNQKLTNFFKSLFHIYPQNVTEQDTTPENLLFLARQQVEAGQFEKAVTTIKKLPASSQNHLQDFIQNVTRYVEARKIIEDYTQERD